MKKVIILPLIFVLAIFSFFIDIEILLAVCTLLWYILLFVALYFQVCAACHVFVDVIGTEKCVIVKRSLVKISGTRESCILKSVIVGILATVISCWPLIVEIVTGSVRL